MRWTDPILLLEAHAVILYYLYYPWKNLNQRMILHLRTALSDSKPTGPLLCVYHERPQCSPVLGDVAPAYRVDIGESSSVQDDTANNPTRSCARDG